jgi:starch-binding outer membrane protein, SusD/RagB family
MKANYLKHIFSAALIVAISLGNVSCVNDLDISSIDPQSSSSFYQDAAFVKQYALLGLTGQKGLAGTPDLDGQDEGESGFYRTIFNCQELPTDECVWVWQDNVDIPQFTNIAWNSSSQRTEWVYVRLGYDITQMNFFLDQIADKTDEESVRQRAEVRFLRALHYAYFLDLFGKAPFKEHFDNELPVEKGGKDLYDFIQKELDECVADMYEPGQAPFGRADKAANWLLRARVYLNAEVYTGTADFENAKLYADKVINSGYYELCDDYKLMFMADNDENQKAMKEIILPIRQDGMKTRNYGGSTYLICGTRTGGMPHMGTTNGWSCLIARNALVYKFFDEDEVPMIPENVEVPGQSDFANDEAIDSWDAQYGVRTQDMIEAAGDDRAMFYSGAGGGKRTMDPKSITGFQSGLSIVKWQNIRSDGASTSHTEYPDTDIPLFRLQKVRKNLGDQLSGGERRRTEIARCLAIDPKFIMLDEPFAGVDPIAVEDIQHIVWKLKDKNIGILITDHNVQETLSITDRAYLLFEGKILFQGTPEELAENKIVREKYLSNSFVLRRKDFQLKEVKE